MNERAMSGVRSQAILLYNNLACQRRWTPRSLVEIMDYVAGRGAGGPGAGACHASVSVARWVVTRTCSRGGSTIMRRSSFATGPPFHWNLAVWQLQPQVVQTVQQHVSCEFIWIRIGRVTIFSWMFTIACCLVVGLGLGLDLVSGW